MTPTTRIEAFLAKICGEDVELPEPQSRVELFLAAIAGSDHELPEPQSRVEMFLAKILDQDVELPVPQSRSELYLAVIAGGDYELPEPQSRIEAYLASWAEGSVLPPEYKRVLGFGFDGDCYIAVTGVSLRGSDTLRFSFRLTSSTACNVLGAYDGTGAATNFSLYAGPSASSKYLRYDGSTYNSQALPDKRYDVVLSPTGSSGMETDSSWAEKQFESSVDFNIGTTSPSATSSKLIGEIFGPVILDGRLRLIPCERLSDHVLGYYDTVGQAFYAPAAGSPTSLGDA